MEKGKCSLYKSANGIIYVNLGRKNLETVTRVFNIKRVVDGSSYYNNGKRASRHEPFWGTAVVKNNRIHIVIEKGKTNNKSHGCRVFNDMVTVSRKYNSLIEPLVDFNEKTKFPVTVIWNNDVDEKEMFFQPYNKVEFIVELAKPIEYEVTVTVTVEELEDAQFGSIGDLEHLAFKVIDKAKKQGWNETK